MANLGTMVPKPETESQARELAVLPEAEIQKAVWQIALKTAPARRVDANRMRQMRQKRHLKKRRKQRKSRESAV
jgi:hypothetical protein